VADRFEVIDGGTAGPTPLSDFRKALDSIERSLKALAEAYDGLPQAQRAAFGSVVGKVLSGAGAVFSGNARPEITPAAAANAPPMSAQDILYHSLTFTLTLPFKDADGMTVAMCRPTRALTREEMATLGFTIETEKGSADESA
jgi:hypothetical protein